MLAVTCTTHLATSTCAYVNVENKAILCHITSDSPVTPVTSGKPQSIPSARSWNPGKVSRCWNGPYPMCCDIKIRLAALIGPYTSCKRDLADSKLVIFMGHPGVKLWQPAPIGTGAGFLWVQARDFIWVGGLHRSPRVGVLSHYMATKNYYTSTKNYYVMTDNYYASTTRQQTINNKAKELK